MRTYKEILQALNDMGMQASIKDLTKQAQDQSTLAQIIVFHRVVVESVESMRTSQNDKPTIEYLGLLSGVLLAAHEPTLAGRLVELNLERPEIVESALSNAAVMATILREVTQTKGVI